MWQSQKTKNHILWQCKLIEEFGVHMIDDLMKHKIFPLYCTEAILHCMLSEEVIAVV
jgi:hypothetical protein